MLSALPVLPGLHIDAQHVIGDRRERPDRAWFDVIALPDGRTAMLVGNVVRPQTATGLGSAGVRTILAEMFPERCNLEAVLEGMNKTAYVEDAGHGTTLSVVVLDPRNGNVDYRLCDHAPPLVVTADGETRPLRAAGGADLPTGLPGAIERECLAQDEVLVLHTGDISSVVRAPAAGPSADTSDPARVMARMPERAHRASAVRTEEICRAAAVGIGQSGTGEDLAVLAVQIKPPVPRLELTVPAVAESLAPAAQAVSDWLAGLRSSIEDGASMALAMGEAVTNAVQHAFVGGRPGSVLVECMLLADGVLVCSVSDNGRWLPAESSERGRVGRGLRMMARVCDRMLIHHKHSGTMVELRRRLHHPVIRSLPIGTDTN